jgi:hypothetical protein
MAGQPTANANPIAALREKLHIPMPRDDVMRSHLGAVLAHGPDGALTGAPARFTSSGETRGILVTGEPGSGKSELVEYALGKVPALRQLKTETKPFSALEPGEGPFWVSLRVSSPATVKSVGHELLHDLGYEKLSTTAPAWRAWGAARHRLGLYGVSTIWIDEAQDLMNLDKPTETAATLRMLKSLMQCPNAVMLVLSGVDALRKIIAQDQQLARRFLKLPLPPITAATDGARLERALRGYCHRVGLGCQLEHELILRIVHAGRGQFGRCVELIIGAIEVAVRNCDAQLMTEHFAERFAAQEGCSPLGNVFVSPRWSSLDLDAAA